MKWWNSRRRHNGSHASYLEARRPVYLTALLPGLRRGELKQLRWVDVHWDGAALAVTVRASISKNHREARLPLHCDSVGALLELRPANWKPDEVIFAGRVPRTKRFRADLGAAGIEWEDRGEGRLDFHSFRVTYCTQLAPLAGTERLRVELMRHTRAKMTAETYTDARMLPLTDAVAQLNFHTAESDPENGTQRGTQTGVPLGQGGSSAVTLKAVEKKRWNR